jgi:GT2 family glycosyltransferase
LQSATETEILTLFISIVLPCYNGASTLAVQLDALARQTYQGEWELIFVDNGSTDGSVDILESYRSRFPLVRILQAYSGAGERRGVGNSYKLGFQAAKGDQILVCEADDELADTWLENMVQALMTCDFACPAIEYQKLNPPELVWGERGQQSRAEGMPSYAGPLHLPFATCCATGMTRACYKRVGDPTEAMGPAWDVDYSWRVQLAGMSLTFVPEAVVHYRVRQSAKARFQQARSWGRGQINLQVRYRLHPAARYLAYVSFMLAKTSAQLVFGTLSQRRPFAFWVWDFGFAWGQLMAFPLLIKAKMRGLKPDRDALEGRFPTGELL